MLQLETALLALETCDRELNALDSSDLAAMAEPLHRRGEAVLSLAAIPTQRLTTADYERINQISNSGARMQEKLRTSRAATCAEWSRLNQEKYLLCAMLMTTLPATVGVDFTG